MIYTSALLKMRNISEKFVENIKHAFYTQRLFFFNSAFYEKMWKNIVETDRPQMTMDHMQMIKKSHIEYVKYIPFPLQK